MSDFAPPRQVSPSDVTRSMLTSPSKLAVTAACCMLLFLFVPTLFISTTVFGVIADRRSVNGSDVAGWVAWIAAIVFIAAAASRLWPMLHRFRSLFDLSAFGMVALVAIWGFYWGPLVTSLHQLRDVKDQVTGLLGSAVSPDAGTSAQSMASVSIYPHFGVLLLCLAPTALLLAKRREARASHAG